MKIITIGAVVVCDHELGTVGIQPRQHWVTISRQEILVEVDPENRPITACPNIGATIKPCTQTLRVQSGYSAFIRIDGRRICLDTVSGLTDGTPPGVVKYKVRSPGQNYVNVSEGG
ncbi:MAG: hypothetical protein GTO18_11125 [Anaerolineales bacterium]|nr:hypothetical protein [Anaerolineales bacterium]